MLPNHIGTSAVPYTSANSDQESQETKFDSRTYITMHFITCTEYLSCMYSNTKNHQRQRLDSTKNYGASIQQWLQHINQQKRLKEEGRNRVSPMALFQQTQDPQ